VWCRQVARIRRCLGRRKLPAGLGDFTYFEIITLLAALAFREAGVRIAVFEAGLGGRLDATRLMNPRIVAVTPVHLDHEAILGDTIAKIAAEKAAVICRGVTVVSAPQLPRPKGRSTDRKIAGRKSAARRRKPRNAHRAFGRLSKGQCRPGGKVTEVLRKKYGCDIRTRPFGPASGTAAGPAALRFFRAVRRLSWTGPTIRFRLRPWSAISEGRIPAEGPLRLRVSRDKNQKGCWKSSGVVSAISLSPGFPVPDRRKSPHCLRRPARILTASIRPRTFTRPSGLPGFCPPAGKRSRHRLLLSGRGGQEAASCLTFSRMTPLPRWPRRSGGRLAVIRVSGPKAFEVVGAVFFPQKGRLADFPAQTIHFGKIIHEGRLIDQVLVSVFRSPHSYTGQDLIEISAHGGIVASRKILDGLIRRGARHAEPGEFTRRAFLGGKMDLTQAEAVLDLIRAKSEKSLESAARQLSGALSERFRELKDELMRVQAHMEAFLDFPEEDLEIFSDAGFRTRFEKCEKEIGKASGRILPRCPPARRHHSLIVANQCREILSLQYASGPRPGAGSEFPGTTRDSLEEALEVGGVYVRLIDTAGLSPRVPHPLDHLGMERTRRVLAGAGLFLFMVDGSRPLDGEDEAVWREIRDRENVLGILNKNDLAQKVSRGELERSFGPKEWIAISSKTREGVEALEEAIRKKHPASDRPARREQITRLRHKNALEKSLQALRRAKSAFEKKESLEFVIVDVRAVVDEIRELIGEVYSEDILGAIFSEFCIGK